jgi:aspartate dehydrogenase
VRVAVIGIGSIGQYLIEGIQQGRAGTTSLAALADVPAAETPLAALASRVGCPFTTDPLRLPAHKPDLIVEAASQAAVRAYAVALLEAGVDLMLMSIGALADPVLLQRVSAAAAQRGRRVHLPAGAIGGLDVLRAATADRIDDVSIVTSKPPRALAGAPFFDTHPVDLAAITTRTVIYDGSAAEAVRLFPANVNVAAAVSLAGIGVERTRMQVVADPALDRNVHEVTARGAFGEMRIRLANVPSPSNPKTSFLACLSGLATLRRLSEAIQIG